MGVDCSPAKCFNWHYVEIYSGLEKLSHFHLYSQGSSSICRVCLYVASVPASLRDVHTQGITSCINMCHLDKSVNLSVLPIMCCALSCALCIHFLLSEFKLFVTRCQSHFRTLSCCPGTSTLLQEMLYSLNSTLGHLVDSDRGVRAADRGAHCCHCIIKCSEDLWLDPESMRRRKRCRDRRVREEVRSSKVEQHFFSVGFLTLLWCIHNDHVKMQSWWTK